MKLNVAVIFGGKSTEHEVSVISALQTIENLDKDKYNVLPLYMTKSGDFYYSEKNLLSETKNFKDMHKLLAECENVSFIKEKNNTYIKSVNDGIFSHKIKQIVDVAFPVVHGTNVEDGNLQGFLHTLNLPVVGPDCLSAAVSMDKYVMKEYCRAIGIPVLPALRYDKTEFRQSDKMIENIESKFKYPLIVKPVNLGSSIGITKVNDRSELMHGLELAFTFASIVLVEPAIKNLREINCAVLGDKFEQECSALEEPFGNDAILSFADKYLSGGGKKVSTGGTKQCGNKIDVSNSEKVGAKSSYSKTGTSSGMASLKRRVPADIDEPTGNAICEYAKKIFKYLGCSGVARIDFMIDNDTKNVYANEINPIPGSLSYYLFTPLGIEYKTLLDKLINIALNNYKSDERLNYTFENNLLS